MIDASYLSLLHVMANEAPLPRARQVSSFAAESAGGSAPLGKRRPLAADASRDIRLCTAFSLGMVFDMRAT